MFNFKIKQKMAVFCTWSFALNLNCSFLSELQLKNNLDEFDLVDHEIETQKAMLEQADNTLNQILEKMSSEVHDLDNINDLEPGLD